MSEVLTHVISSQTLDDDGMSDGAGCPRTHLGLACIRDMYPCLCQAAESWSGSVDRDNVGEPVAVNMWFELMPGVHHAKTVFAGIEATGRLARLSATPRQVEAVFALDKVENRALREKLNNKE